MWGVYILLFSGGIYFGIDAQTTDCCQPNTAITATVNVLETIRVTCTPEFTTSCKWVITAPAGTVVGVEFSQVVVGRPNEIRHTNADGNILSSFSGQDSTVPLLVGGTSSTIEIFPDATNSAPTGGQEILEFKYIAAPQTTAGDTATACDSPAGEIIDLSAGDRCITSPSFPQFYPEQDQDCKWTIQTDGQISYSIPLFHLEASSPCDADFFTITEGGMTGQRQCNRDQQGMSATGLASPIVVDFHSDDSDSFPGFLMCFVNIPPTTTPTTTTTTESTTTTTTTTTSTTTTTTPTTTTTTTTTTTPTTTTTTPTTTTTTPTTTTSTQTTTPTTMPTTTVPPDNDDSDTFVPTVIFLSYLAYTFCVILDIC